MNQNISSLRIVWVEVGRKLPRYATRNISLTAKCHPLLEQILVTDNSANGIRAKILRIEDVPESDLTRQFHSMKKNWAFRQQYFWHGTTARFFHLYDAMKFLNIENVLHLETDCVLLAPEALDRISGDEKVGLAYPLQAQDIGCASIFYVRNHEALKQFLEFIIENWLREDVDDMTLLGEYSKRSDVKILPSKLRADEGNLDYLFDAQSVGKFFFGTDARNCRLPFSKRGLGDNRVGSMTNDLLRRDVVWQISRESKKFELNVRGPGLDSKYANIHIHSKSISGSTFVMGLAFRMSFSRNRNLFWRIGFIDFAVAAERFVSFCARRVLRLKHFEERNLR